LRRDLDQVRRQAGGPDQRDPQAIDREDQRQQRPVGRRDDLLEQRQVAMAAGRLQDRRDDPVD